MNSRTALCAALAGLAPSASSEILISQYYEGSSGNNKWIELTNTSATGVSLDGFAITSWSNAATEDWKSNGGVPTFIEDLTGFSIPANGFFLIGNPGGDTPAYATSDLDSVVTFINGDDSIVLYNTALGAIGDPAAIADALSFTDAGNEGADKSVYRINDAVGFDLTPGSTFEGFPAVWGTKTEAEVQNALNTDPFYLQSFHSNIDLTVSLSPNSIAENAGPGIVDVTVTRTGPLDLSLDLVLASSDSSEAIVPSPNRQIPAGQASATFPMAVDAVDDTLEDGTQQVRIEAHSPGTNPGFAILEVTNDGDVHPLVINEVLIEVPAGADVNRDRVAGGIQEQFVEIVNKGVVAQNISGFELSCGASLRHCFPNPTILEPGCAVCVFGGGSTDFIGGSTIYQTASEGSLCPIITGDDPVEVLLSTDGQVPVAGMNYESEIVFPPNHSLVRDPELTGAFTSHTTATGSGGETSSPGTKIDGSPICPAKGSLSVTLDSPSMSENGGSVTATITRTDDVPFLPLQIIVNSDDLSEAMPDLAPPNTVTIPANEASVDVALLSVDDLVSDVSQLVDIIAKANGYDLGTTTLQVDDDGDGPFLDIAINEIHHDPAPGSDANGDGVSSSRDDEFIEWLNLSDGLFDLSGFMISDSQRVRHIFPPGSIVAAGQAIIVFGGGVPTGGFGGAEVQTASTNFLSLNNAGDSVILQDRNGDELARVDYDPGVVDESLNRINDDGTGDLVAHSSVPESGGSRFSPGTQTDGSAFESTPPAPGVMLIDCHVDAETDFVTIEVSGLMPDIFYVLESAPFLLGFEGIEEWTDVTFLKKKNFTEVRPGVFQVTVSDSTIPEYRGQLYRIRPGQ